MTRILLVEDDANARRLIEYTFKEALAVDAVATGEEALAQAASQRYAAVLMDINLCGGMDGIETQKALRRREGYDEVPVVALTAAAMPGDREHLLAAGFDAYLSKPFRRDDLFSLVSRLVGSVHAQQPCYGRLGAGCSPG